MTAKLSRKEELMRRRFGALASVVLAAVLATACAQSDPGITTAVKTKLAADDTVKSYRIDVDTKDRVVTLTGAVDTPTAKTRAVELARNTEGVRDVVDQLAVTPGATPTTGIDDPLQREAREATQAGKEKSQDATDRVGSAAADATITTAIKTKMLADDTVPGMAIDVDTSNGIVTLKGTVRTPAQKERAAAIAKATDNVKSVVNNLKVEK
jgi:hyperosmotically inducible protein